TEPDRGSDHSARKWLHGREPVFRRLHLARLGGPRIIETLDPDDARAIARSQAGLPLAAQPVRRMRRTLPGPAWLRQKAWFLPKPPPPAAAGHLPVPGSPRTRRLMARGRPPAHGKLRGLSAGAAMWRFSAPAAGHPAPATPSQSPQTPGDRSNSAHKTGCADSG